MSIAQNKKAFHDYFIEEKLEAGATEHGTCGAEEAAPFRVARQVAEVAEGEEVGEWRLPDAAPARSSLARAQVTGGCLTVGCSRGAGFRRGAAPR